VAYFHGRATLPGGRTLHRFSTVPTEQALILYTASAAYAISPQEGDAFIQDLEQRRRLGAIQPLAPGIKAGQAFFYAFWNDRVVRVALVSAALLNLALLGWLMSSYPGLPPLLELRSDAAGAAAALAPRHQILFLPLAGAALGLLNIGLGLTLYGREPVGARMLQVASAGAQILFAVAALTILRF
jgi:Bacterial PH domain